MGEAPIYMKKGVAAPAPKTSLKWLGRTSEGGPTCLRQILCSKYFKELVYFLFIQFI
jgi:hypothetical protein